jgi:methionyl-tRNA formyltransferase
LKIDYKILFICKKNNHYCEEAANYIEAHFDNVLVVRLAKGEGQDCLEVCNQWQGDLLISYLSPLIIPEDILNKARMGGVNLHPGPPEYPGIGCTNFAIYNEESRFGVTCHYMEKDVDSGSLIWVRRFPIHLNESVYSLTQRCYTYLQELFYQLMDCVIEQKDIPLSEEVWLRKPYTRKQLNDLALVTDNMSDNEVLRRIRAMNFPGAPGAYRIINGSRITLS